MSSGPWETAANAMKARLDGWAALGDVIAIVDRQKDISSEVLNSIEKAKGIAISILFEGFRVPDENMAGPQTRARYAVRVWGLPIIADADADVMHAEDAAAETAKALHFFRPSGAHSFGECHVRDCDLVNDPNFLCYELTVEVDIYLT